jgi:soluble lytic murein transglycosylase
MARKPGRRKRAAVAVILCVVLVAAAVTLGALWALYRAYPYNYRQDLKDSAAQFGLDPLLVAAVIKTESSWRPAVKSGVGATGLMQIMPDTGRWIAGKNGWEYDEDKLTDAAYNIRLGCWYLAYLSGKFDGSQTLTLAAYNAGDNTVEQWISEGRFENGRVDIPFPETRSFVRKVMDAYEKYKFLYHWRGPEARGAAGGGAAARRLRVRRSHADADPLAHAPGDRHRQRARERRLHPAADAQGRGVRQPAAFRDAGDEQRLWPRV